MLPKFSAKTPIEEEYFLMEIFLHAAFDKMSSSYFRTELRTSARCFLQEFTSAALSSAASWSKLCQEVSGFCQDIILAAKIFSAFFLFGQWLDGLIVCGW